MPRLCPPTTALRPGRCAAAGPSAILDPRHRRQLIALLRSFEHTRLVATHDPDLALEVRSRVIVLSQGAAAADGSADEILNDVTVLEGHGLEKPLRLQGCPRHAQVLPLAGKPTRPSAGADGP